MFISEKITIIMATSSSSSTLLKSNIDYFIIAISIIYFISICIYNAFESNLIRIIFYITLRYCTTVLYFITNWQCINLPRTSVQAFCAPARQEIVALTRSLLSTSRLHRKRPIYISCLNSGHRNYNINRAFAVLNTKGISANRYR